MAPERSPKRVKTNPSEEGATPQKSEDKPLSATCAPNGTAAAQTKTPQNDPRRSSWFTRTWPRKAAPMTEVARESISSASNAATEAIASVKRSTTQQKTTRSPSLALALGKTNSNSNRALPAEATTSTVHATPDASPKKPSTGQLRLQKSELEAKESPSASSTEQTKDTKETETSSHITSSPAVTNDQVGGSVRLGEQSQAS